MHPKTKFKRHAGMAIVFLIYLTGFASLTGAGPRMPGLVGGNKGGIDVPAVNTLPQIRNIVSGVAGLEKQAANRLVVRQNKPKAVLEWNSFNIGANASTHFDQKGNRDWAALNRIFDKNPSLIFGKLSADGKIYLINQNGTLFGSSAKVNVHSLAASSLHFDEADFLANRLKFKGVETAGKVTNYGQLTAESGGSIFLIAPEVENAGVIITPSGQIGLIAGTDVEITSPVGQNRLFPFVYVANTGANGTVSNAEDGRLEAEGGLAGLYGRIVNQKGLIKSVTAITNKGRIELHAAEKVVTGPRSVTQSPISDDPERVHQSFNVQGGEIHIAGLDELGAPGSSASGENIGNPTPQVEHRGVIEAPSGTVEIVATERVHLSSGSRIDVSGEEVLRDIDSTIVSAQLNSVELKNDFGQKGGLLQGQTVDVNPQTGSSIGDLTGALNFEFLTAREKSTKGGIVAITAPAGEIIVREGAVIDFSGGRRTVSGNNLNTTLLVAGNQVYDIRDAPQWITYNKILDTQQKINERYSITKTFTGIYTGGAAPLNNRVTSFIEGDDAGELRLVARGIVLDGDLMGAAYRGIYQTELKVQELMVGNFAVQQTRGTRQPRGGSLIIGGASGGRGESENLTIDEIVVAGQTVPLPDTFGAQDPFIEVMLDGDAVVLRPLTVDGQAPYQSEFTETRYWDSSTNRFVGKDAFDNAPAGDQTIQKIEQYPLFRTVIAADKLSAAGLSDLRLTSNTRIAVQSDATISMVPGGLRVDEGGEFRQGVPLNYLDLMPATLSLQSRAIEFAGTVRSPSGRVTLDVLDTVTSPFVDNPDEDRAVPGEKLAHRILLAAGSRLDVSGDRLTNDLAGIENSLQFGRIEGGVVALTDATDADADGSIVIASGATIDVSGGYELDPSGNLRGADAGRLSVKASAIVLEGTLKGYSLRDHKGGEISLHADLVDVIQPGDVQVLPDGFSFISSLPDDMQGRLMLADNHLDNTGFTRLSLISGGELNLAPQTRLRPSHVKLRDPDPSANDLISSQITNLVLPGTGIDPSSETFVLDPDLVRDTSISLQAASPRLTGLSEFNQDAVNIPESAVVEVSPRGTINLSGRSIDLAGTLIAPAGDISVRASGTGSAPGVEHDLILRGSARLQARGINVQNGQKPLAVGLPADVAVYDGGSVSLSAANNLRIEAGALIDVSGSLPVERLVRQADNTIEPVQTAGAGGSINFSFRRGFSQNGRLIGKSFLDTVRGGSLTLSSKRDFENDRLLIGEDESVRPVTGSNGVFFGLDTAEGFSDMTFETLQKLVFLESVDPNDTDDVFNLTLDGKLTLDAPVIMADLDLERSQRNKLDLRLGANWLVLRNSNAKYDGTQTSPYDTLEDLQAELTPGDDRLSFSTAANWIDIQGDVAFSGFETISLESKSDIRLSDELYAQTGSGSRRIIWRGAIRAPADINLTAARVYPTIQTDFAILTASESGRISIARPDNALTAAEPIYSAGGRLTAVANEIEHQGYLAAPLGQIVLTGIEQNEADSALAVPSLSTIVLGEDSVTSTHGDLPVLYGNLADIFWSTPFKPRELSLPSVVVDQDIETAPEKSIKLLADNAIVRTGAVIDASGGGEIFGFEFIPGTDGLADPFLQEGRHVIVPGISLPGAAVTLVTGTGGLPTGTYSLLPPEYAFVPGALVLDDLGATVEPFARQLSEEGYPVAAVLETAFESPFRSAIPKNYSVRPAEAVFQEGNFSVQSLIAGEGGRIELQGNTTILDGTVQGGSMPGFGGGVFAVSGGESAVVRFTASIPDSIMSFEDIQDFLATEEAAQELVGKANIRAEGLSRRGLGEVIIGTLEEPNPTRTVTVESRAELETTVITLAAKERITMDSGSALLGIGEGGTVNFRSPVIETREDSRVQVSEVLNLDLSVNPDMAPQMLLDGEMVSVDGTLILTADNISIVPDGSTVSKDRLFISDKLTEFSGFSHLKLNAATELNISGGVKFGGTQELQLAALDINAPVVSGGLVPGQSVEVRAGRITLLSPDSADKTDEQFNEIITSLADDAVFDENTVKTISLAGDNGIDIGPGHLQFKGFNRVNLSTSSDLRLVGQGSVSAGGELNLAAARVSARPYISDNPETGRQFEAADFTVNAGRVGIRQNGRASGSPAGPGGKLNIVADSIRHTGTIDMMAGRINVTALDRVAGFDNEGIYIGQNARISSTGGVWISEFEGETLLEFHRGGTIVLRAENGDITLHPTAKLDVSNRAPETALAYLDEANRLDLLKSGLLDAGDISIEADTGTVFLQGAVSGRSAAGRGGGFTLSTRRIATDTGPARQDAFSDLNQKLTAGGFNRLLNIRSRAESILVRAGDTVKADVISLTADAGGIDIRGMLDASGRDGGRVELYAGRRIGGTDTDDIAIWLRQGAVIDASGSAGSGGEVLLSAADDYLQTDAGSLIDVSGTTGGGQARLRARRSAGDDPDLNLRLFGNLDGAADIAAVGVLDVSGQLSGSQLTDDDIQNVLAAETAFKLNSNSISAAIAEHPHFRFIPEFEIKVDGNFDIADDIDLTALRYGWDYTDAAGLQTAAGEGASGALTLRVTRAIRLAGNLVDHPTSRRDLNVETYNRFEVDRSWDFNLVAGADLGGANFTDVRRGAGSDLVFGNHLVYTENGDIRVAAGGNLTMGLISSPRYMINSDIGYNLASYAGNIQGRIAGDLVLEGGAVQTALGDIDLKVGRNLELDLSLGSAIRTTGIGTLADFFQDYVEFDGGGSIFLDVGNDVTGTDLRFFGQGASAGARHLLYWDNIYVDIFFNQSWSADFGGRGPSLSTPTAGVATMAGGDLQLRVGGNLDGQFGTFKGGDLSLIAQGDIGGYFQLADGAGFVDVMGNVRGSSSGIETSLAMLHGDLTMTAQGNIHLGAVFNPTLPDTFSEYSDFPQPPGGNLTYSSGINAAPTAFRLAAAQGDVSFSGNFRPGTTTPNTYRVLPPVLEVRAGRDIRLNSRFNYALAPAATGNLKLIAAGGSVTGLSRTGDDLSRPQLYISDLDPKDTYFSVAADPVLSGLTENGGAVDYFDQSAHDNIHVADPIPVRVIAAEDIQELELFSPKATRILAGGNIQGLHFIGQNLSPDDLTAISAKGDIRLASTVLPVSSASDELINSTGYIFNGPGSFLVQAGGLMNLGISRGIQSIGNAFNNRLSVGDPSENRGGLFVMAGLYRDAADSRIEDIPADIKQFFQDIKESGELIGDLRAKGELDEAAAEAERSDLEVIEPFFGQGLRGQSNLGSQNIANGKTYRALYPLDENRSDLLPNYIEPFFTQGISEAGNILMTSSQISSSGISARAFRPFDENRSDLLAEYEESSDLFIIAGDDTNVGLTAIPDPTTIVKETDTGIFTAQGGGISIFTVADLNVNESRVMSFRGGDILLYSQFGNINAGRGSKTAINAGSPNIVAVVDDEGNPTGDFRLVFEPPSVGSGIRTLTYDPDGILGPQPAPLAGDGFLFAPRGIIDAGEAGIATRNLTLAATQVINAQNIDVGGVSVGVPQAQTGPSLGALAGAGSLNEANKIAEDTGAMRNAEDRMEEYTKELSEALLTKYFMVEVIGFE